MPPKTPQPSNPHPLEDPDPDEERPTLVPAFDLQAFARDSEFKRRAAVPATGDTTVGEARRLLEEGEPEQALFLLARLLEATPLHAEANALSSACAAAVERMCWSAIGPGSGILVIAVSPKELTGFRLDHVSGFLLSLMDGRTDVDTMLDLSGVPRLLALRHLRGLMARGIVRARKETT